MDCSVTSVTLQLAFLAGGGIPPRRLGDGGARHRSRPRGWNSVPRINDPNKNDCGDLRPSYTEGIGPDQLPAPKEKSTTHGQVSDQQPRTEGNSRPRHTGVEKAPADRRLGPTVYEVCYIRLKDSSVTSVTVQ
jgi:hypothetical protein